MRLSYSIVYIFLAAAGFASSILILGVFARFVQDSVVATGLRAYTIAKLTVISLLTVLAVVSVGLQITDTAYLLSTPDYFFGNDRSYSIIAAPVSLAFQCVYLLAIVGLCAVFARGSRTYNSLVGAQSPRSILQQCTDSFTRLIEAPCLLRWPFSSFRVC